MISIGCPSASAAVKPKILSAAGFQVTIVPESSVATIASVEYSTIAARRASSSAARFRSVMSRAIPSIATRSPASSRMGTLTDSVQTSPRCGVSQRSSAGVGDGFRIRSSRRSRSSGWIRLSSRSGSR